MKKNLFALFSALLILVLLVWAAFYAIVSRQIRADAEYRAQLTANQIMDNLSAELAELERLSFLLSSSDTVLRFVQARDTASYYKLANEVSATIATSRVNEDFVGNMILYRADGSFFRFSGNLSNTSCMRVWYLSNQIHTPAHMAVELEYQNYIGYVSAVHDSLGNTIGTLVMLAEEARILDLIHESALGDSLLVTVMARGEVVATNFLEEAGINAHDLAARHIGLTPFEIMVSVREEELSSSMYYFSVAALVTATFFGLLIFVFIGQMNRRVLSPMIRVMQNVEELDWAEGGSYLPSVENEDFDALTSKINDMLLRIEGQSGEIKTAELRATTAELQKQKAIIFSLKKQINAHFVINTLSTIRILVERGDIAYAGIIINDLSALIRYAYEKNDMIDLWSELQMLEYYVSIMNVRHANKIEVIFDVDDRLMDVMLPRMLLQPIVENAILHGHQNKHSNCEIRISAAQKAGQILLSVSDNGIGISNGALNTLRQKLSSVADEPPDGIENIALINIKRQLQAHYGARARLTIESQVQKGTEVILALPYCG